MQKRLGTLILLNPPPPPTPKKEALSEIKSQWETGLVSIQLIFERQGHIQYFIIPFHPCYQY